MGRRAGFGPLGVGAPGFTLRHRLQGSSNWMFCRLVRMSVAVLLTLSVVRAFAASPPDLPSRPLMALDFAITRSLVRPGRPRIRFLFIGSRLCSTLPSDPASRRRPCASLILHRHQAG